ncbi:MAG: energy-coupling factor transporter ATPase [Lachnospiraceae bacterium]
MELNHINYTYSADTAFRIHALKDISLKLYEGQFIGIIGHTGSGKSTLIQHLNGLIRAERGRLLFRDKNIYDEDFVMPSLRKKVGLVFQYPEYQLFEATVLEDVMFGPKNLGKSEEEARQTAIEALKAVGADESLWDKSPFELSGGQKRRVAIAGVLAMETEVLILDEPTAALDPKGRDEILGLIDRLHKERKITIILVSHSMEDVAKYADRIIVMNKGEVSYDGTPEEVFSYYKELEEIGLAAPQVTYLAAELRKKNIELSSHVTTVDRMAEELLKVLEVGYNA